jgi:hypothetical protein
MYAKTTLTAVLALLASTAFAGQEGTMTEPAALPTFSTLDTNSDGAVSREEAQASADVTAQWSSLDADQNGSISSTEYSNASGTSEDSDTDEATE